MRHIGPLLVLAVIAAGCSTSEANLTTTTTMAAVTTSTLATTTTSFNTTDFQNEILADGIVTLAEMERAVGAYTECLVPLGVTTEAEFTPEFGSYSYSFSAETDVEAILDGDDGRACKEEFLSVVEYGFADTFGPTDEERTAFYEAVAQCMRDRGFTVAGPNPVSLQAAYVLHTEDYLACFDEVVADQ